ncbi:hypothetical protein RHMOL_Rhmol05G0017500 [Rhododendron molle]|uniref:Uncharacterized protein n=1 Tax=Rhododendron molle TaxID=49168 RepID=A0ACC0NJQ8_RHOML|nr:hypothetical protein RHMOL_Rhmol05G0017500 [Rhododendron molle]
MSLRKVSLFDFPLLSTIAIYLAQELVSRIKSGFDVADYFHLTLSGCTYSLWSARYYFFIWGEDNVLVESVGGMISVYGTKFGPFEASSPVKICFVLMEGVSRDSACQRRSCSKEFTSSLAAGSMRMLQKLSSNMFSNCKAARRLWRGSNLGCICLLRVLCLFLIGFLTGLEKLRIFELFGSCYGRRNGDLEALRAIVLNGWAYSEWKLSRTV